MLLFINAIVDYFLLLATAFFTREPRNRLRIALAALAGSLFSLALLLPELHLALSLVFKVSGAAAMSAIAFGAKGIRRLLRNTAYLFVCSCLFAGALLLVERTLDSGAVVVRNGEVYLDISALTLSLCALAVYVLLCLVELLFRRPRDLAKIYEAAVETDSGDCRFRALLDSGNKLKDPLGGRSVVVLRRSLAPKLLSEAELRALAAFETGGGCGECAGIRGVSLIPFSSVGKTGALLGFRAKRCVVKCGGREYILDKPAAAFADDSIFGDADGIVAADDISEE